MAGAGTGGRGEPEVTDHLTSFFCYKVGRAGSCKVQPVDGVLWFR